MKSLEESVSQSLDGSDTGIMKYLPYLLRDMVARDRLQTREINREIVKENREITDYIGKINAPSRVDPEIISNLVNQALNKPEEFKHTWKQK